MAKHHKRYIILFLTLALAIVCFVTFLIFGSHYSERIDKPSFKEISGELRAESTEGAVELSNFHAEDDAICFEIHAKHPGEDRIIISDDDDSLYYYKSVYVHYFNIVSVGGFFGRISGDIIVPISLTIILAASFILTIKKYRQSFRKNPYQYHNVSLLSLAIFLGVMVATQLLSLFSSRGIVEVFGSILTSFSLFSVTSIPVAVIMSLLCAIAGIHLMHRNGFTWRNMLGTIISVFFGIVCMLPTIIGFITQTSEVFAGVHNLDTLWPFVESTIESCICAFATYLECILIATIAICAAVGRRVPSFDQNFLVILGCQVLPDNTPSKVLGARIDRAIEFRNRQVENGGHEPIFVCSGGQGSDEKISEAQCMCDYLLAHGIKRKNILLEDKSTTTDENLKFSRKLIETKQKNAHIAIVTTNYHVFRAGLIANKYHLRVSGLGTKVRRSFWVNAIIREYAATITTEKKRHLITLLIIFAIVTICELLTYFSMAY